MRTVLKLLILSSTLLGFVCSCSSSNGSADYPNGISNHASRNEPKTSPNNTSDNTDNNAANNKTADDGSNYAIIAGDVLQVTVWKEEGLDQEVLVLSDGSINYPLIGSVQAQGKSPGELQDEIKEKLSKLIPDASVTVAVKAALGHTVSVIGQVNKPGEVMMGHGLTVMQALSQAGGLTAYASDSDIIVLHHNEDGKEISTPFPYDDVIEGHDLDKDFILSPGDVVVVPTAGLL